MIAAADILHKNDPSGVTKTERQIGKVAILALRFGGSVGALKRMALNYRIHLEDAEARRIVEAWREANPWAPEFWGAHRDGESFGLWGAAMRAWEIPGQITTAGRLAFVYREDYLGGTLFMALPSGRLLTYPRPRWRDVDVLDKDGKPTGEKRHELSFRRAHGRAKLWHGTLAENAYPGCRRRPPAPDGHPHRNQPGARVHADPHDDARRNRRRGRRGARRRGEGAPAARNADAAGLGRGLAAAVGGSPSALVHQSEGGAAMNAPFSSRRLWSHQQRAATFLYERDAAFLIAPLGAGKGAAALTALAELIRDEHRRHALVIAPKLVATTVWPDGGHATGRTWRTCASPCSRAAPSAGESCSPPLPARDLTVIGVDIVPWLVGELAALRRRSSAVRRADHRRDLRASRIPAASAPGP